MFSFWTSAASSLFLMAEGSKFYLLTFPFYFPFVGTRHWKSPVSGLIYFKSAADKLVSIPLICFFRNAVQYNNRNATITPDHLVGMDSP